MHGSQKLRRASLEGVGGARAAATPTVAVGELVTSVPPSDFDVDMRGGAGGGGGGRLSAKNGGVTFNLLVVDDSSMNRKMLCKLLENRGHRCDQAKQGQEAVDKIMHMIASLSKQRVGDDDNIGHACAGGSGHGVCNASSGGAQRNGELKYYDAILMDFVMPEMDGPTATKLIREQGFIKPIYGITGNALQSDIDHFIQCGADRVFTKPLDIELFLQTLVECLGASANL
jgi:CheY-like chemotaxis protein